MRLAVVLIFSVCVNSLFAQIGGKVVGVADGDTFTLLTKNNKPIKIRLHGIDCPEKGQDFGNVAKDYTSNIIFGKLVTVTITDTDRYGRVIGVVKLSGRTLNEDLIRNGLAWHYCKYDSSIYWHFLQDSARKMKVGLWSDDGAIEPWVHRKLKKQTNQ